MKLKTIKYRLAALTLAVTMAVPEVFGNYSCAVNQAFATENGYDVDIKSDAVENKDESEENLFKYDNADNNIMNEASNISENDICIEESDDTAYGSASGLSGSSTSSSDDFNISGSVINYMKKHGSSTTYGNYPYYLVIPKKYTLKEYAFTGDPNFSNNIKNADHVAAGCCYFSTLSCNTPAEAILTTLPEGAFYSCTGLKTISQMPEKLDTIAKDCFAKNTSLAVANFNGTHLKTIGDSAFEEDKNLVTATWDNTAKLGSKTFYNCSNLSEVGKISSLGKCCFENCTLLSKVDFDGEISIPERAFYNCQYLKSDLNVKNVGKEAFENCYLIETANVNGDVDINAFDGCINLKEVNVKGKVSSGCFNRCNELKNLSFEGDVPEALCCNLKSISKVSINNAVKIGDCAFDSNKNLTNMDFSKCTSLQEIGKMSFKNTNLVGGIQIPQAVTQIGEKAFYSSSLPSVYFENNGLVDIGKEAFAENNISELVIKNAKINEKGFASNPLVSVTLESGLTEIGKDAFSNNGTLKNVKVNAVPGKINEDGIFNNSSITSISLDSQLNKIQDNLFRNAGFGNVDISFATDTKLTTIGSNAFKNATGLKSVILPDSITTIGEGAFDGISSPDGSAFYVLIKENSPTESILKKYNSGSENVIIYKILLEDGRIIDSDEYNKKKNESENESDNSENTNSDSQNEENESESSDEKEDNELKTESDVTDYINMFSVDTNYFKDYVSVNVTSNTKRQTSNEIVNDTDEGKIALRTDTFAVDDENKQNVTYEFVPNEGVEITEVYIDSINKGAIKSYTFNDGYDHIISINIKFTSEEGEAKLETFNPFEEISEYYIDIAYHPEYVSVSSSDTPHILYENDKYCFVRYYFKTTLEKNKNNIRFLFSEKGSDKILKVYLDGEEIADKYSVVLNDEKHHLIVIENENATEITANPSIPEVPTPTEPCYRTYDDNGNIIDKTKTKYKISYILGGGKNSPYNVKYFYEGSVFYFRDAEKENYNFKGWYFKERQVISTEGFRDNLKLKALYDPKGYNINYIMNGGVFKNPSKVTYSYNINKTVKLKKPRKTGYKFIGWFYGDLKMTKLRKNDATKGNITLVAHWAPNSYTIKFSPNGAKGKMNKITNCAYNQYVQLPVCVYKKDGYVCTGFNTKKNGTGISYKELANVTGLKQKGTITLYAQWKKAN